MTCGIYKIENKLNGKVYIGQSIHIEARWKQHLSDGDNRRKHSKFYQDLTQLGKENFSFEILEECEKDKLNEREIYWIKFYNSFVEGYNETLGGQGKGSFQYSPEIFQKLWDAGKSTGEITQIVGCCPTVTRNRLTGYSDYSIAESYRRGGVKAFRENPIINNKGEDYPVYQYSLLGDFIAEYASIYDVPQHIETTGIVQSIKKCLLKQENRTQAGGFQWSKEKVDKMPPIAKHCGRLVQCIETGEIFLSIIEASKAKGLKSKTGILQCCNGTQKTAGGLHWKFI